MTKLPLEPLMEATHCTTAGQLGLIVGMSRDNVQSLKFRGVPIHSADALATACGLHPTAVWGDDFYKALYERDVTDDSNLLLVE